ncbi:MAG: VOC family protein [Pirellulales bacterium]
MSVPPIPPGMEGLIPHLVCENCNAAIDFYVKAFGATEICRMPSPDGKRLMHAEIKLGDAIVFLADDFPEYCGGKSANPKALGGTPISIHRYVPSVDAAMDKAVSAGATVEMPAMDMFWGDRYGVIVDPFGHKWSFATHLKEMTAEEMAAASKEAFAQADAQHG